MRIAAEIYAPQFLELSWLNNWGDDFKTFLGTIAEIINLRTGLIELSSNILQISEIKIYVDLSLLSIPYLSS